VTIQPTAGAQLKGAAPIARVDHGDDVLLERRFRTGVATIVGSNLVSRVLGMMLTVLLARYLGQTDFGKLSYIQTFLSLFSIIPSFGLDRILARELARFPEQSERVLANAFAIKAFLGVPTAIAALLVAVICPFGPDLRVLLVLASVLLLGCIFQPMCSVFEARLDWTRPMACDLLCGFAAMAAVMGAMAGGASFLVLGSLLLLLGRPGAPGLPALLCIYLLARQHIRLRFGYERQVFWPLLRSAAPAALSGVLVMSAARVDQLLIAPLLGVAELGRYSAAARLTEGSGLLASALVVTLVPLMTRYASVDSQRLERVCSLCFRLLSAAALAVSAVAIVAGDGLLTLLLGKEYRVALAPFQVLVLAQLFVLWMAVISPFLIATQRVGFLLLLHAVNASSNLVFNLWLIPRFGIAGAAVGTFCSFGLTCVCLCFMANANRFARIMWTSSVRPAIAVSVSIAVFTLLRWVGIPPVLAGSVGLLAYPSILVLIRGLTPSEVQLLFHGRVGKTADFS
jgi:O-antigen/teichoic acid export membrane protein